MGVYCFSILVYIIILVVGIDLYFKLLIVIIIIIFVCLILGFDNVKLKLVKECKVIDYFRLDGVVSFDFLIFVVFIGINYDYD